MDKPIWSALFARQIAETLGYAVPGVSSGTSAIPFTSETEQVVQDVTEAFRYLGPDQLRLTADFAAFLRSRPENREEASMSVRQSWAAIYLAEVRELARFLRERYGAAEPADEKDYWTEEDRRDAQAAAWRRMEEEDPYPWEEADDAHAG